VPAAPPLKGPRRADDSAGVPREKSCPICNADFPLRGDEKKGEEVYCSYCGAPCRLSLPALDEACEIEEDF